VARAGHEECVQAAVDDHAGQAPTPWFRTACGLHQLRSRLLGLPVMAALASYFRRRAKRCGAVISDR
jgi:hypothetical protein